MTDAEPDEQPKPAPLPSAFRFDGGEPWDFGGAWAEPVSTRERAQEQSNK